MKYLQFIAASLAVCRRASNAYAALVGNTNSQNVCREERNGRGSIGWNAKDDTVINGSEKAFVPGGADKVHLFEAALPKVLVEDIHEACRSQILKTCDQHQGSSKLEVIQATDADDDITAQHCSSRDKLKQTTHTVYENPLSEDLPNNNVCSNNVVNLFTTITRKGKLTRRWSISTLALDHKNIEKMRENNEHQSRHIFLAMENNWKGKKNEVDYLLPVTTQFDKDAKTGRQVTQYYSDSDINATEQGNEDQTPKEPKDSEVNFKREMNPKTIKSSAIDGRMKSTVGIQSDLKEVSQNGYSSKNYQEDNPNSNCKYTSIDKLPMSEKSTERLSYTNANKLINGRFSAMSSITPTYISNDEPRQSLLVCHEEESEDLRIYNNHSPPERLSHKPSLGSNHIEVGGFKSRKRSFMNIAARSCHVAKQVQISSETKKETKLARISLCIVWLFIFCHVWKLIPTAYETFFTEEMGVGLQIDWPYWLTIVKEISHSLITINSGLNFLIYIVL